MRMLNRAYACLQGDLLDEGNDAEALKAYPKLDRFKRCYDEGVGVGGANSINVVGTPEPTITADKAVIPGASMTFHRKVRAGGARGAWGRWGAAGGRRVTAGAAGRQGQRGMRSKRLMCLRCGRLTRIVRVGRCRVPTK